MSFILDALKKADEARHQTAPSSLGKIRIPRLAPRQARWPWVLGGAVLLALNAGVIAYVLWPRRLACPHLRSMLDPTRPLRRRRWRALERPRSTPRRDPRDRWLRRRPLLCRPLRRCPLRLRVWLPRRHRKFARRRSPRQPSQSDLSSRLPLRRAPTSAPPPPPRASQPDLSAPRARRRAPTSAPPPPPRASQSGLSSGLLLRRVPTWAPPPHLRRARASTRERSFRAGTGDAGATELPTRGADNGVANASPCRRRPIAPGSRGAAQARHNDARPAGPASRAEAPTRSRSSS